MGIFPIGNFSENGNIPHCEFFRKWEYYPLGIFRKWNTSQGSNSLNYRNLKRDPFPKFSMFTNFPIAVYRYNELEDTKLSFLSNGDGAHPNKL
jgi:hypothetical protein